MRKRDEDRKVEEWFGGLPTVYFDLWLVQE